jgi:DNA-binding transcriptional regulator YhcF (GntR family)
VSRAFRELELGGFVTTRGRHGTFVTDRPILAPAERQKRILQAALDFVELAHALGIDRDAALHLVERSWD